MRGLHFNNHSELNPFSIFLTLSKDSGRDSGLLIFDSIHAGESVEVEKINGSHELLDVSSHQEIWTSLETEKETCGDGFQKLHLHNKAVSEDRPTLT